MNTNEYSKRHPKRAFKLQNCPWWVVRNFIRSASFQIRNSTTHFLLDCLEFDRSVFFEKTDIANRDGEGDWRSHNIICGAKYLLDSMPESIVQKRLGELDCVETVDSALNTCVFPLLVGYTYWTPSAHKIECTSFLTQLTNREPTTLVTAAVY